MWSPHFCQLLLLKDMIDMAVIKVKKRQYRQIQINTTTVAKWLKLLYIVFDI